MNAQLSRDACPHGVPMCGEPANQAVFFTDVGEVVFFCPTHADTVTSGDESAEWLD